MKKILYFIVPIIILVGLAMLVKSYVSRRNILGTETQNPIASPTPTEPNEITLDYQDRKLNINWFEANPSKTFLIPNFSEKDTSKDAIEKYGCVRLTNGGFYSLGKDMKPIGLFINDDGSLGKWQRNSLFDGVLSLNFQETPRITESEPRDILRVALQSGPLIKENASYRELTIKDDVAKRRVLAFTTGENRLFMASVYDSESNFSGPLLTDLPKVLSNFEQKTGIVIADAINLDGGSASTYNDGSISLPEITLSGSFFCIKN